MANRSVANRSMASRSDGESAVANRSWRVGSGESSCSANGATISGRREYIRDLALEPEEPSLENVIPQSPRRSKNFETNGYLIGCDKVMPIALYSREASNNANSNGIDPLIAGI